MLEINNVHSREPIPLAKVLNNIKKQKFKILENAKLLRKALVEYVLQLKNLGWKNTDNYLLYVNDLDNEELFDEIIKQKCDICKCLNDESTVILPCQHYFHENCILDYLKNFVKDSTRDDVFKCPYCTKELNIIEIL